jgi:hypothetical protein
MTCPTTNPTHKRGDTFDRSGQITVRLDGAPVLDLTGWTGRAQVRTATGDDLIAECAFAWLDATQSLCRVTASSTAAWPIGPALVDIELTAPGGAIVSTDTASLMIVRDITRPL